MRKKVTVIGTVFMDVKGFALQNFNPQGRNLGNVKFVHGGVGRNVVETLAGLDLPTRFISTVDNNGLGQEILTRLNENAVETKYIQASKEGMGLWLAVLDENGDLASSISQVPHFEEMHSVLIKHGQEIIQTSSHLALEVDLTEAIARKVIELAKKYNVPVYGLPGNMDIVMKHPDLLNDIDCFVCNHIEASRMMNISLDGLLIPKMIDAIVNFVNSNSLHSVVVTLGSGGSIYYDRLNNIKGHQPVFPVDMVDSCGAGDAFFSGTVLGLVRGLSLDQAVICGTKVAGWVIESSENNCPNALQRMVNDPYFEKIYAK